MPSKKPPKLPTMLFCCCIKPNCKTHQRVLEFMLTWGLDRTLHADGRRRFVDVTVPDRWQAYRRERFALALRGLAKEH